MSCEGAWVGDSTHVQSSTSSAPTRLLLAEHRGLLRDGVRALLEARGFVVAAAPDGRAALRLARQAQPDAAIVAARLPDLPGLDVARALRARGGCDNVVLLGDRPDALLVRRGLRVGVRGFVLITGRIDELIAAIEAVGRGGRYVAQGADAPPDESARVERLTERQQEVLRLVAEGLTTEQIARRLGIRYKTAEAHRTNIMARLDIHSVAGLVRFAVRHGMVEP